MKGLSRLCVWMALSCVGTATVLPPCGFAQDATSEEQEVESIFLPAPRTLRQHLTRARKAVAEQRFGDAVSELGALLTSPELNQAGRNGDEPQDFFLGTLSGTGTQTSLKTEAQRLLGSMPARGRELYELQYGAEAKSLLDDAVRNSDVEKLTEVTRRYFHTRAGYEATVLLGRLHLDRGRPLAAALCWSRVLELPNVAARFEPDLSVLLAAAYLQANRPERAESVLQALRERMPRAQVRIGADQTRGLPAAGQERTWLQTHFLTRVANAQAMDASQWTIYRGNAARIAGTAGDLPLRNRRWEVPAATQSVDERLIADVSQGFTDEESPALPASHPLAIDNLIVMRTAEKLLALDFDTGKRIWEYPWWDRPDTTASDGRKAELMQRVWYDSAYGQLSSDGEAIFFLDELTYPAPNMMRWMQVVPGGARTNPNSPASHNELVALGLPRQGDHRWSVGGETGLDEPKLAGAFFLGAPLPLFGQLYLLAEINGEIRLVVLDAQTGRQEWSQQLAHVDSQTILENPRRRLVGASPSFADGILVCPTSAGAVVAVDVATRSLLWGFQYGPVTTTSRNFGIIQPYPSQLPKPGDCWMDATVTLADGAVLLTPPESNKLYCLDLLTGELRWPPRERANELADMMYIACVHQGNVVLVGRTQIAALRLADGKPAWSQSIALSLSDREMPSGRGFYSDRYYYLPTTTSQLLKVDLVTGKIVERTKTDRTLGNLICYKNQVIGQNAAGLAVYYQTGPLRQQVAERLAKEPADSWALARQGELLVNDGDIRGALTSLRKAHQLNATDAEVRNLLVNAFLIALRDDFPRQAELAPQIEPLIDDPLRQITYLRILSAGLQSQGKLAEAWRSYARLADLLLEEGPRLPTLWESPVSLEPAWSVRLDCWYRAKFAELLASADSALQIEIDRGVAERLLKVLPGSMDGLKRFLALVGPHPRALEARLHLIDSAAKANEWLVAEMEVAEILSRAEPLVAKRAMAELARAAAAAGQAELAAYYYRELQRRWPKEPCYEGKTGEQLFAEARANTALQAAFTTHEDWKWGRVKTAETPQGLGRQSYRRIYSVPLETLPDARNPVAAVFFDANLAAALTRDADGKSLFPVKFDGGYTFYAQQPGISRAASLGGLLIVAVADQIAAVDTLRATRNDEDAVIWRENLSQSIPDLTPQSAKSMARFSNNPLDPDGQNTFYLADAADRPLGHAGPVTRHGVYFQKMRTLICADPLTGRVNWSRSDVPHGSDLFGDEELICAISVDGQDGVVLSAINGQLIKRFRLPGYQRCWTSSGRNALIWNQDGEAGPIQLTLFDVAKQAAVWQQSFPHGARGCLIGGEAVAVLSPEGELLIRSLTNDRVLAKRTLEREPDLTGIHVMAFPDQYLLFTTREETSNRGPTMGSLPIEQIRGRVYAFDRRTGEPQWQVPASIDGYSLPLRQPSGSPAVWLVRQDVSRAVDSTPGGGSKASVLCLDRRTGRALLHTEGLQSQVNMHEIVADRAAQTSTLSIPGYSFVVTFTDEPGPPEPPVQSDTSGSAATAAGERIRRLANTLREALSGADQAPSPFDEDPPPKDQRPR